MHRRPSTRITRRRHIAPWRPLRQHPGAYWAVVAALALCTALLASTAMRDARPARSTDDALRRAAIARHTIEPGQVLDRSDYEWRDLPAALVPDNIAPAVDGKVATATMFEGEAIVGDRLAPGGVSSVAALLPRGSRALAVPLGQGAPPLHVGDYVDLLATVDPSSPSARVAQQATVVDVTDELATVAVDLDEARDTAYALSTGTVVVALAGP